ncbi:MAG: alpha/beta hydrolase, partial [Moorea sp. SIO2I5]|nr:alpha/beta hydrolase [Moorena sp. SIO2I5]
IKISPVAISRLGKSPMGEAFLEGLGKMIKTHPGRNGLHSLRGALVLAAADSEGLTVTYSHTLIEDYSVGVCHILDMCSMSSKTSLNLTLILLIS